jgi:hypothetical protein
MPTHCAPSLRFSYPSSFHFCRACAIPLVGANLKKSVAPVAKWNKFCQPCLAELLVAMAHLLLPFQEGAQLDNLICAPQASSSIHGDHSQAGV